MRQYVALPPLPDVDVALERYTTSLAVIVPVARTNMITNPSFETTTSGWTASGGTITRTTEQQYHGAYSLKVTPTTGLVDGAYYSPLTMQAGNVYAISCKLLGAPGVPYKLAMTSSTPTERVSRAFIGTGQWQWIWLVWAETGTSTSRRIYIQKAGHASTQPFYVDGVQVELCGPEGNIPTTYIDGDQTGYLVGQHPPAYLWLGTPHASMSVRSGQTRTGGRLVKFSDLGFWTATIIGLGLAIPQHAALSIAQLDGSAYQRSRKTERTVSFVGRWQGMTPTHRDATMAQLGRLLDRDQMGTTQPLTLCLQANDCGQAIGEPVTIPQLVYSSGLEGTTTDLPASSGQISFTQYLPFVTGRDEGTTLPVQQTVTDANLIMRRSATGIWSSLGTGGVGTVIYAIVPAPDGTLYAAGAFTNMGGSGAQNIAKWDGSAWSALGSVSAINGAVYTLAIGPDGSLYVGGTFTSANGVPNTTYLAKWDGSAWSALGSGVNNVVYALAVDSAGNVWAGGDFSTAGGVSARVAKWDGATWTGTGSVPVTSTKLALLADARGSIYVGGSSSAAKVAKWDGTTWTALGSELNGTVNSLALDRANRLYAGGQFTLTYNGTLAGIAMWSGTRWEGVGGGVKLIGSGSIPTVNEITVAPDGSLLVAGVFNQAGTIPLPDMIARWNGTWSGFEVDTPGTGMNAITATPDGRVFVGFGSTGSAQTGSAVAVVNHGSVHATPTFIIRASSPCRLYTIANYTTGALLMFDVVLNTGETATLTLDPRQPSFLSSFRGSIWHTILPGSTPLAWMLQPGTNMLGAFGTPNACTVTAVWPVRYASLDDALYQARLTP